MNFQINPSFLEPMVYMSIILKTDDTRFCELKETWKETNFIKSRIHNLERCKKILSIMRYNVSETSYGYYLFLLNMLFFIITT